MHEQCNLLNIMDVRSQGKREEKHVQSEEITGVFIPFLSQQEI